MKILDLENRERNVEYVKKIIHETKDMNDETIEKEMIEVVIIGNKSSWVTWYEYDAFRLLNKDIDIIDDHLTITKIIVEDD